MKIGFSVFALSFLFAMAPVAHAWGNTVTTPYWCGSYWSSYPCAREPQPYYTQYPYQYQYPQYPEYPCSSYYNNYCNYNYAPSIYTFTPTLGVVGTSVTIRGTGFTSYNTVRLGPAYVYNVPSTDGRSLTFSVPSQVYTSYYPQALNPGNYDLVVITSDGRQSNSVLFTVTLPWWATSYGYNYGY